MTRSRLTILTAVTLLLIAAPPLESATDAVIYSSFNGYIGTGKHPSRSQTALVIDMDSSAINFVCFAYALQTKKKIKGRVSVEAELVTPTGTTTLYSVNNLRVESFDIDDLPDTDNPCVGELPSEDVPFNFGFVSECRDVQVDFASGDFIRWIFRFSKMSKLKGQQRGFQVLGEVLPEAFTFTSRRAVGTAFEKRARSLVRSR